VPDLPDEARREVILDESGILRLEIERAFGLFYFPVNLCFRNRYLKPDFVNALKISKQTNMYAYDAYFLDCAIRHKAPLLTLDRKLKRAAQNLNIETMEV